MSSSRLCLAALLSTLAPAARAQAPTWTATNATPGFAPSTMLQLNDGRVLVHDEGDKFWFVWTPDAFGSYQNGTFTQVASTQWTRLYFASGVLANGKVVVAGGEYSDAGNWTNKTEVYDPELNTWTVISPPSGWNNIGDAPNVVLEDGRFFLGSIFDKRTAYLNPDTLTWTAGLNQLNNSAAEETWILLPEGTAMKWYCFGHPGSGKYDPASNSWVSCGNTPVDLVLPNSLETGAAVLLPDGRTFCIGGTPRTALYAQGATPTSPGSWTVGPNTPITNGRSIGAEDAPAAFLPNGNVLCCFGPVTSGGGSFEAPTYFFEYDTPTNTLVRITDPPGSNDVPYRGHMLVLPTGEVAWCNGHNGMYLYTNGSTYDQAWKPAITSVATALQTGVEYILSGTQLNGVTNGASYGDEAYCATNYPLVRLTDQSTGHVFYARTFGHPMGVQTGAAVVSTHFVLPATVPDGSYALEVVASGIPSDPVTVTVGGGGGPGGNYCTANANSTGLPGVMDATGSDVVADNDLTLIATQLPANRFGYFITSMTQDFVTNVPNSQGNLCLGGQIVRFANPVLNSGPAGEFTLAVDLTSIPPPYNGPVLPGQTWNFQAWYRDVNPTQTSNFTDGRSILFQ